MSFGKFALFCWAVAVAVLSCSMGSPEVHYPVSAGHVPSGNILCIAIPSGDEDQVMMANND